MIFCEVKMNSMRTAARYSNGTTVVPLSRQEKAGHPERRLPESKDPSGPFGSKHKRWFSSALVIAHANSVVLRQRLGSFDSGSLRSG